VNILSGYVAINIRREYTDAIDKIVATDCFIFSRAEFVKIAIREKLEHMGYSTENIQSLNNKKARF